MVGHIVVQQKLVDLICALERNDVMTMCFRCDCADRLSYMLMMQTSVRECHKGVDHSALLKKMVHFLKVSHHAGPTYCGQYYYLLG